MIKRKFMLMAIFLVGLLAISAASATDLNGTDDTIASDEFEIPQTIDGSDDVVRDNDEGTFTALQEKIENASEGSTITLDCDYAYTNDEYHDDASFRDGVYIDKNIIINGNGHIIDGSSKSRIFFISSNKVVLNNIQFVNGHSEYGAAVYILGQGNFEIFNCSFYNNHAEDFGGAVYGPYGDISESNSISAINCIFINNTASDCGALYHGISINCTFNNNSAIHYAGAQTGISINSTFANNKVYGRLTDGGALTGDATNCIFINNSAYRGGAIKDGGATNCTFIYNHAEYGGALSVPDYVENCVFINNTAKYGGAIFKGECLVKNSIFTDNHAEEYGGAICSEDSFTAEYCGDYMVEHCSFINNSAEVGGACFRVSVNNCTFTGNVATEYGAVDSNMGEYQVKNSVFINNFAYYPENKVNYENCKFIVNASSPFKNSVHAVDGNKFSDIQQAIYHALAGDIIELSGTYIGSGDIITINKPLTISGKDATVDARGLSRIFDIKYDNVTLENLKCINGYGKERWQGAISIHNGNVVIKGCEFVNNTGYECGAVYWKGNNGFLRDCIFSDNTALRDKGSFVNDKFYYGVFEEGSSRKCVGAIYWDGDNGIIENCNYDNNSGYYDDLYITGENVEIREVSTILTVGDVEKYYKGSEKLQINLADSRGNAIANADVKVTFNGKTYTVKTDSSGNANVPLDMSVGTYDVVSEYDATKTTSKVKVKTTLTTSDAKGVYLNSKVNATFLNTNGKALANNKVNFKIGTATYSATTNSNGVATANIPLGAGTYTVTAVNPANNEEKQFKLTITKAFPSITVSAVQNANGVTLTASLTPNTATGNVTFMVGSDKIYPGAVVKNGKASMTIPDLAPGTYRVAARYNGDSNLEVLISDNVSFKVDEVYPILTANDLTKTYGNSNKFVVNLIDSKGNTIANAVVNVNINSQITPITTDANGQATMAISLKPAKYDATATYGDVQATAKITVKKATPKITASKKTFKTSVKTKKYTITLKTNKNKVMKNKKVTLKVNGKTYSAKTNSNGKATFKITKLTKKASFNAVIKFAGNSYYNKVSKTVKITVKK